MQLDMLKLSWVILGGVILVGCVECTGIRTEDVELSEAQIEEFFGALDRVNGGTVAKPPPEHCGEVCTDLLGDAEWVQCERRTYDERDDSTPGAAGAAAGAEGCLASPDGCQVTRVVRCSKRVPSEGCGFP